METWNVETCRHGDLEMEIWKHGDIDMKTWKQEEIENRDIDTSTWEHGNIQWKTKAQMIFLTVFHLMFAHSANGSLSFVRLWTMKQRKLSVCKRTKWTKRTKQTCPSTGVWHKDRIANFMGCYGRRSSRSLPESRMWPPSNMSDYCVSLLSLYDDNILFTISQYSLKNIQFKLWELFEKDSFFYHGIAVILTCGDFF
jgi:hypothetical protein